MTGQRRQTPRGPAPILGRSRARDLARCTATVAAASSLVGLSLLAGAAPASAHNQLIDSDPPDGVQVADAPSAITLTYNQPVSTRFATVTVSGPDGGTWQQGEPDVSGATVTQPLAALGPAGRYEVAWRVVSADGHPITGTQSFTLTTAGTGTPVAADGGDAPADEAGTAGGVPGWPAIAAGLVLGAAALGVAAWAVARRWIGAEQSATAPDGAEVDGA